MQEIHLSSRMRDIIFYEKNELRNVWQGKVVITLHQVRYFTLH